MLQSAFRARVEEVVRERQRFDHCERLFFKLRPSPPSDLTREGPLGFMLRDGSMSWTVAELRQVADTDSRTMVRETARLLIPPAEQHEEAVQLCADRLGLPSAEEAYGAALDAVDRVCVQILRTAARSPVGLAIKARVVRDWGEPRWWDAQEENLFHKLAAQVLDAAIMMGDRQAST
jgi:hypothetical protein